MKIKYEKELWWRVWVERIGVLSRGNKKTGKRACDWCVAVGVGVC